MQKAHYKQLKGLGFKKKEEKPFPILVLPLIQITSIGSFTVNPTELPYYLLSIHLHEGNPEFQFENKLFKFTPGCEGMGRCIS